MQEFSFFKRHYHLEDLPWRMLGDFWSHEYSLSDHAGRTVMSLSKAWFTWGDSYRLDIPNPHNELLCLCIALAVDCMNADASNSA